MGLLTAAQIAAIPGNRVRQMWRVRVPEAHGDDPTLINIIGVSDPTKTDGTETRIVDAGVRSNDAGNLSPQTFGNMAAGEYSIVVSNADGYMYQGALGAFGDGGSFAPLPTECHLEHWCQVWTPAGWTHLPCSPWTGKIIDVIYQDTRDHGAVATIITVGLLSKILKRRWTPGVHSTEETVCDYAVDGPIVTAASSGWYSSGGHYHLWLQFTTSLSYYSYVSYDPTKQTTIYSDDMGPATLHRFDLDLGTSINSIGGNILTRLRATVGGDVLTVDSPPLRWISSYQASAARPW